ncbi:MAG: hypothetical protein ACTHMC_24595 [Pseudobacter sp.]|uniref:hypothetical protein n=1 Tax=Pseudobacter sp. TaxID=2045420 RepID=UPI003F7D874F
MITKRILIIILSFLGLIAVGILIWSIYKKGFLRSKVTEAVSGGSMGIYSISFDKFDLDEVNGNLSVSNVHLQPDTVRFNQLAETEDAPGMIAKVQIPSLQVAGVKTPKALLDKEVEGRKVLIENPVIELYFTNKGKDSANRVPDKELYEQLLGNLAKIAIDTVSIVNATVITRNLKGGDKLMQFDSVQIDLYKVAVDSIHSKDSTRFLFAESAGLLCKKIQWKDKRGLYEFVVSEVDFNTRGQRMSLGRFSMNPQLPEAKFLQQFKYANDRFDIDLKDVQLVNLNVAALMRQSIAADSLIVTNSNFKIYRDLSYPHDGKSRLNDLPHQALMRMPVPLVIKQVSFPQSFIEYKERNGKSDQSGKVQFYNVNVAISNLTNDTTALKADPICKLRFHSRFLNKAPLTANIDFYPLDKMGKFTINGTMGAMPAITLNQLTVPMGLAKIEKGTIRKMTFNFTSNIHGANGPLTLLYDDIGVTLLKKDEETNTLDKKKLASLMAKIVLRKANPGKDGEVRTAQVKFERDTKKSFFNLLWKSVFTGVKENVGM